MTGFTYPSCRIQILPAGHAPAGARGLIAQRLPAGLQKGVRELLVAGRPRQQDRTDHGCNCAGGGLPRI